MSAKPILRVGLDASPLGGAQSGVGNYVRALLDPVVAAHPEAEFFLYSNGPIEYPENGRIHHRVTPGNPRGPLWQVLRLPEAVAADRLDVYWGTNGFLPSFLPRSLPLVVTVHDLAHRFAPATQDPFVRWNRRLFQPLAVRRADRVVAVSRATGEDIRRHYGRPVDEVVHPLVAPRFAVPSPDRIRETREKFGLPENYLLSVATLEPRKNIAALITAAVRCRRRGVPVPLLALAGGRGWKDSAIARTAEAAEADGIVRRLGFVPADDLPPLYGGCAAFVFPSLYEGFGMPLVEAQLCGAPVVFGSHASMREAAGDVGLMVEPTTEAIERALERIAAGESVGRRDPGAIPNSPAASAAALWRQFQAAVG